MVKRRGTEPRPGRLHCTVKSQRSRLVLALVLGPRDAQCSVMEAELSGEKCLVIPMTSLSSVWESV